jgi:hypothetical protein
VATTVRSTPGAQSIHSFVSWLCIYCCGLSIWPCAECLDISTGPVCVSCCQPMSLRCDRPFHSGCGHGAGLLSAGSAVLSRRFCHARRHRAQRHPGAAGQRRPCSGGAGHQLPRRLGAPGAFRGAAAFERPFECWFEEHHGKAPHQRRLRLPQLLHSNSKRPALLLHVSCFRQCRCTLARSTCRHVITTC